MTRLIMRTREYPGSSDRDGVPADEPNFVSFLKNLRSALDDAGDYGLSITLPSSYWYMQWFDIVDIEPIVDWVSSIFRSITFG